MGIYVNEELFVFQQNNVADELARQTAETWRELHKDDVAAEPIYDARGKQINRVDRSEVLIADTPTHTIIQRSDGTVFKTNTTPAPVSPPVDQQPKPHYSYSRDDLARLLNKDHAMIQCGGGAGAEVIGKERPPDNLFGSSRR